MEKVRSATKKKDLFLDYNPQTYTFDMIYQDSQLMTEFLIGSWLGTGFRIPEVFGNLP
jgi:hypothetical protein